jgi:hypothetical protein
MAARRPRDLLRRRTDGCVPDNESSAKIDTAISEAIEQFRQRIKDLDAELERIDAAREEQGAAESDTAGGDSRGR